MINYLNIGGGDRPVLFGFAALYQYEQATGRNALHDFAEIQSGGASVTTMISLLYSGLCAGARHLRQQVDFEPADVAEWVGSDVSLFRAAAEMFAASFPQSLDKKKSKPPAAKKLTVAEA